MIIKSKYTPVLQLNYIIYLCVLFTMYVTDDPIYYTIVCLHFFINTNIFQVIKMNNILYKYFILYNKIK